MYERLPCDLCGKHHEGLRCPLLGAAPSSPELSPSTEKPQAMPNPSPTPALKSLSYDGFEAWCRSLSGMQLWECLRIALMVMLTHMNGATGTQATPKPRRPHDLSELEVTARRLARSSQGSTPEGAKDALSEGRSHHPFSLDEATLELARAQSLYARDPHSLLYPAAINFWIAYIHSLNSPATSAGTAAPSRSAKRATTAKKSTRSSRRTRSTSRASRRGK